MNHLIIIFFSITAVHSHSASIQFDNSSVNTDVFLNTGTNTNNHHRLIDSLNKFKFSTIIHINFYNATINYLGQSPPPSNKNIHTETIQESSLEC